MPEHEAVFRQVQGAVSMRARRGDALDTIEEELIGPSGLPDAHKAALTLEARSHLDEGTRRYERRQDDVRRRARRRTTARGPD